MTSPAVPSVPGGARRPDPDAQDRLAVVWSRWREDEPTVRQELDPRWLNDAAAPEPARPRAQVDVDLVVDPAAVTAPLRMRASGTDWSALPVGEHVVELDGVRLVLRVSARRSPTGEVPALVAAPTAAAPPPPTPPRPSWRRIGTAVAGVAAGGVAIAAIAAALV